ncbi:carbon storage regulator [Rhodanobacter denitrificans]|uniref:carbon storage regulator n=1 Tax=Rhodanobacter denitrificans TaxID=666685 RepID=UPI001F1B2A08|nr:carbon storage regulator [Rhodanobacter denitrificans]UJJ60570.1 carbon storage regulator [Rhodanobacter denitrificans]
MALLLTRRRGQGVTVEIPKGDGTVDRMHLKFVQFQSGACRVAFDAPAHVTIIRDELIADSAKDGQRG